MVNESQLKVFICYASENRDLMAAFVRKFKAFNHNLDVSFYDQIPAHPSEDKTMHDRFVRFARQCDIAIILASAFLAKPDSYASKFELPILKERRMHGEVILVGIVLTDFDVESFNKMGVIDFAQIHNADLPKTRADHKNSNEFNNRLAVYNQVHEDDQDTYQKILRKWIDDLFNKRMPYQKTTLNIIKESRPKAFICYAGEDYSLVDDFVQRFKMHNDLDLLYDRTPHSGNIHEQFQRFASECDVAILLVNARFTNLESYANRYEIPILLERQHRGEVIIIGVRFSDVALDEWNKKGDVYFLQVRNDALHNTRRKDDNGDVFNRQFATYEILDKRDRDTFHVHLNRWIDALLLQKGGTLKTFLNSPRQKKDDKIIKKSISEQYSSEKNELLLPNESNIPKNEESIISIIETFDINLNHISKKGCSNYLKKLGDLFNRIAPLNVERLDLIRLLDMLIKLKLKHLDNMSSHTTSYIDLIVAEISLVVSKEPKQRTKSNILFLTKLGGKLRELGEVLSW